MAIPKVSAMASLPGTEKEHLDEDREPAGQGSNVMSPKSAPAKADNGLETANRSAIASCGGKPRATVRALILGP
jgi:hypothetical protein